MGIASQTANIIEEALGTKAKVKVRNKLQLKVMTLKREFRTIVAQEGTNEVELKTARNNYKLLSDKTENTVDEQVKALSKCHMLERMKESLKKQKETIEFELKVAETALADFIRFPFFVNPTLLSHLAAKNVVLPLCGLQGKAC